MTDLFQGWKQDRFIIADDEYVVDGAHLVVLSDYRYWANHIDELVDWCKHNNAEIQGMTVVFKDKDSLLTFALKWL
jgi:hypothetical protein